MKKIKFPLFIFFIGFAASMFSQNLVTDGGITSSNANWNGQEAPFTSSTYQGSYIGACGNNYIMEVDNLSSPTQTLTGFENGEVYILNFRYAYRTSCAPSNNPTTLRISFTDAPAVLDYTLSIPNTVTSFASAAVTFTNNAASTHTFQLTNPGNTNSCGVIIDDISILLKSSPGGVTSSSVSYWVKGESISLPNSSDVYAWHSQGNSVLTVTAPCANRPVYMSGLASVANNLVANYNPYITFNGTNQYLGFESSRQAFLDASNGGNGASVFLVYQGGTAGRTIFGYRGTNNTRVEGKSDSLSLGDGGSSGTNNNLRFTHSSRVNIVSSTGKHGGLTISDLNGANQTLNNNSINSDFLTIGARRASTGGSLGRFFNGSISEVILVDGGLNSTQMQRIRSYLASKYGVTLSDDSNTAGLDERDYTATDGSVYWNYSANSGYHHNITVIGKDNQTGLNQRRSISTDSDAGSNTGNAMLILDNNTSFSANLSYLAAGHNGTFIPNPGGADFFDVPFGIQSRLKRVWK